MTLLERLTEDLENDVCAMRIQTERQARGALKLLGLFVIIVLALAALLGLQQ